MSEEKMREAFKRIKGCEMKDAMACAVRDFEDGWKAALQESEAGAVLYMARNLHSKSYATSRSKAEAELFLLQSGLKIDGKESVVIPLYALPQSEDVRDSENLLSLIGDIAKVAGRDVPDCVDNDGQPYQSAALDAAIKAAISAQD